MEKVSGAGDGYYWDASASSGASVSSGDVYAQAQADRTDTYVQFGLGRTTSPNQNTIDFAVLLTDAGQVKVAEMDNIILGLGTYQPGDVFKVSVESGVVKYYKNGTLFYTSTISPTYPLYYNAVIADMGGRILNALNDEMWGIVFDAFQRTGKLLDPPARGRDAYWATK